MIEKSLAGRNSRKALLDVRLAVHVSNGCKFLIRPSTAKIK